MTKTPAKASASATAKKDREPPSLTAEFDDNAGCTVAYNGDWKRLRSAYQHEPVIRGLLTQVVALGSPGNQVDETATNFLLAYADAMQPRDATEMLLLTQMAATHQASMVLARRLNHADTIGQQDAAERAFNKLARTFTAQMDTLKKYRSKGKQVVRVERVNVESGAQAVVGNVETGGRVDAKK